MSEPRRRISASSGSSSAIASARLASMPTLRFSRRKSLEASERSTKPTISRKGVSGATVKIGKSRACASSSRAEGTERKITPTPKPMAVRPWSAASTTSARCVAASPRSLSPVVSSTQLVSSQRVGFAISIAWAPATGRRRHAGDAATSSRPSSGCETRSPSVSDTDDERYPMRW